MAQTIHCCSIFLLQWKLCFYISTYKVQYMRFSTLSCVDHLQLDIQILTVNPSDHPPAFLLHWSHGVVTKVITWLCTSAGTPEGDWGGRLVDGLSKAEAKEQISDE